MGLHGDASTVRSAAAYTDPDRFRTEREVLFRAGPALMGLSGECREPGSYLTGTFGGIPVVVVRQQDGSLRAMVNACRHRGAPLLEGHGSVARITCGFHAWSYRIDGSLHSRPFSDGAFDDVATNCDLHPVGVGEAHGLIFVRPNADRPVDVGAYLHGASDDLDGLGLARCAPVESRTNVWQMNWKLLLDTFGESYHIRTLHRSTIAPTFDSGCTIFEPFGPHLVNVGFRSSVAGELAKPPGEGRLVPHGTIQYFLLPNAMLCYQVDHVELWRIEPLDVRTTRVTTSVFADTEPVTDEVTGYLRRNLDVLLDVTGREDFPLMERIQATLASGALAEVIYGRNEPALAHFHRSVDAALAAGGLD